MWKQGSGRLTKVGKIYDDFIPGQVEKSEFMEMLESLPPSVTVIAEWELTGRSKKSPPLATRVPGFCFTFSVSSSLWHTLNTELPGKEILESAAHALEESGGGLTARRQSMMLSSYRLSRT